MFSLLATVLVLYVAYAGLMFVQQRAMMFPGTARTTPPSLERLPPGAESHSLPASFGAVRVVLLRAAGADAQAPAVIFHAGNFEFVDQLIHAFPHVAGLGLHVLLVEYPGYAGAPGKPTFASLVEASTVAYDWLAQRPEVDASRIVAMGRSVGGGPACELTRLRPVRALVLMSSFSAIADFARGMWLPPLLARDRFDNVARLRQYAGPALIFHGRRDEIIPFAQGRTLAQAARQATFVPLDCGHNDCPYLEAEFARTLGEFLRRHGILSPMPGSDSATFPSTHQGPEGNLD